MTAIADATDSSTVEQLIATVEDLQETVEQQADRIDELETELAEHKDHTGLELADVRARITEAENQQTQPDSEDDTPGGEGMDTPLEQIINLPESIVQKQLSANERRARFVAKDIHDYADKTDAGYVVTTRQIRRVLKAGGEIDEAHTQTMKRVKRRLAEFGGEDVWTKKRKDGQEVVTFSYSIVDRIVHHDRCDRQNEPTPDNSVILVG